MQSEKESLDIALNLVAKWKTQFGKAVYVIGNHVKLGNWEVSKAIRLQCIKDNIWGLQLLIQVGHELKQIQYKFFMAEYSEFNKNTIEWQSYKGNRIINLQKYKESTTICSFNIRYLTNADKGQNHWEKRKVRIVDYLRKKKYDFVGVQQATLPQRVYLQESTSEFYDYYGRPRDLAKDEECGIFISKQLFTVLQDSYQWISQSKIEGSVGYDAKLPRYFTTLLVSPNIIAKKYKGLPCLAIINLHLDHVGVNARTKGVQQVLQKCKMLKQKFQQSKLQLIGCVIMGDFNISQGSEVFNILTNNQQMRFKSMRQIEGADRSFTFNGFQNKYLMKVGSFLFNKDLTIDHMYYWAKQHDKFKPLRFIVDKCESDTYLSDHYPIVGTFWN